jgi:hypothetical protein
MCVCFLLFYANPLTQYARTHTDLHKSLLGFSVSTVLLAIWIIVFQTSWRSWGAIGEQLLVVGVTTPTASGGWG